MNAAGPSEAKRNFVHQVLHVHVPARGGDKAASEIARSEKAVEGFLHSLGSDGPKQVVADLREALGNLKSAAKIVHAKPDEAKGLVNYALSVVKKAQKHLHAANVEADARASALVGGAEAAVATGKAAALALVALEAAGVATISAANSASLGASGAVGEMLGDQIAGNEIDVLEVAIKVGVEFLKVGPVARKLEKALHGRATRWIEDRLVKRVESELVDGVKRVVTAEEGKKIAEIAGRLGLAAAKSAIEEGADVVKEVAVHFAKKFRGKRSEWDEKIEEIEKFVNNPDNLNPSAIHAATDKHVTKEMLEAEAHRVRSRHGPR